MEKQRLLRHISDGVAQGSLRYLADILAVYGDFAGLQVDKPQKKFYDCRFAAARRSDQTDFLPAFDIQIEFIQEKIFLVLIAVIVFEIHLAESDIGIGDLELSRIRSVLDQRRINQQLSEFGRLADG